MVGETGFEPATLCSQSRCATRLRYSPTIRQLGLIGRFANPCLAEAGRWWARQDSNLQPSRYERPALPLSYRPSPARAAIAGATFASHARGKTSVRLVGEVTKIAAANARQTSHQPQ